MTDPDRGPKRRCAECRAEYFDKGETALTCPACRTQAATEAAVAQPLRSVWGAPFRK